MRRPSFENRSIHLTFFLLLLVVSIFYPLVSNASGQNASPSSELNFWPMAIGLFGGLTLFLYGMEKMSDALKRAAGDRLKLLLKKLTSNRLAGVMTGTMITAVIQSSSVTTVLVVGFISAGLMSLTQAVGVIMGANIGTTITAQIIAFKVTKAALAIIALGYFTSLLTKGEKTKQYGNILFGLGMIFLGMNMMSEAMSPLRTYQPFVDLMAQMDNRFLAILVAALFTALVQSSSATTGIVIVLAGQGFISLEAGIALAMGANMGTCVTALLAAMGKSREAMQASAVHILFNTIGVLIWLPFISALAQMSISVSPEHVNLVGVERLAAELPRQIANANTIFNLLNTLIMLPFAGAFVSLVRYLFPHHKSTQEEKKKHKIQPKYLSEELLSSPDMALDQAQLELGRIGRRVCNMMNYIPPLALNIATELEKDSTRKALKEVENIESEVDRLHAKTLTYLGKLRKEPLSENQSHRQIKLVSMIDQLESAADLVIDNMVALSYKSINEKVSVSPVMRKTLDSVQERVNQSMLDCVNAIRRNDDDLAKKVLLSKREINSLLNAVLAHQAERLSDTSPDRLTVFRYEMEWVESLKRIYTLSKRIAKLQLRKQRVK